MDDIEALNNFTRRIKSTKVIAIDYENEPIC